MMGELWWSWCACTRDRVEALHVGFMKVGYQVYLVFLRGLCPDVSFVSFGVNITCTTRRKALCRSLLSTP